MNNSHIAVMWCCRCL